MMCFVFCGGYLFLCRRLYYANWVVDHIVKALLVWVAATAIAAMDWLWLQSFSVMEATTSRYFFDNMAMDQLGTEEMSKKL